VCPWAGKTHDLAVLLKQTIPSSQSSLGFFLGSNQLSWRNSRWLHWHGEWLGAHQMSSALWRKYISILFLFFNFLTWWRRDFGRHCRPLTWNNPQCTQIRGRQIRKTRWKRHEISSSRDRKWRRGEKFPNEFFRVWFHASWNLSDGRDSFCRFRWNYLFYFWPMWRARGDNDRLFNFRWRRLLSRIHFLLVE